MISYVKSSANSSNVHFCGIKSLKLKTPKQLSINKIEDISETAMGVSACASAVVGGIASGGDISMVALGGGVGVIVSPLYYAITKGSLKLYNKIIKLIGRVQNRIQLKKAVLHKS